MLMQNAKRRRSIRWILLVILSISLLTGCAKQRASWFLKNAQKRVQEARSNDAPRFSAPELKTAEDKIKEAQGNMASQNFEGALASSREAAELAKQLLEGTIQKRANVMKTEAEKNLQIAADNQGQQANGPLFEKIQKANTDAATALGKNKFQKTIDLCLQVENDVKALLEPQRLEAEKNLADTKTKRDKLIRERANEEAPSYVTDTDRKIREMQALIQDERQYRKANQLYRDIVALIDEGITKSRWSRSKKKIAILEQKLVRAINEEADVYTPDFLELAQQKYQDIMKNYLPPIQDYEKVLQTADLLEPQLDDLILQARILASTAKINAVKAAIRTLDANKVRTYLPGRLEKVEELLKTAEAQFKQQQFDECKKTCKNAIDENNQIVQSFNDLAASEVRTASGTLDEASSVLEQMGRIFAIQSPTTNDPVEQAFESGKRALKAVLDAMVRDARVLLGTANVQREDSQFSNAIENARLVVAKSNYVIRETFHTVAHNNVLEIANKITQVSLNGGARFAQPEIAQAKSLLEDARKMIRDKEAADKANPSGAIDAQAYRAAVAKTSEAKAAVEVSVQRVTQGVTDKIGLAHQTADTAESNKAGVYALGDLSTARQVIQQANDMLTRGQLFDASNKADQAFQVASDANVKSLRSWANDAIAAADEGLKQSEKAGADNYASPRYKEALNQIESAKELVAEAAATTDPEKTAKTLSEAKDLAIAAKGDANDAKMEPVTQANRAIVKARTFNAWEEDYPALMQAVVDARTALEDMQAGKYWRGKAYADRAAGAAERATCVAQRKTYERRMQEIKSNVQQAAKDGGTYFNVKALREVMTRIQEIRQKYNPKDFETISAELDQFETDLYKVTQNTPEIFKCMVDAERALYEDLVKRGARDFADKELTEGDQLLRFATLDFNAGKFRSSYDNLRKGVEVLNAIDLKYKEQIFVKDVRSLFAELAENEKKIDPLLKIPVTMMHLVLWQPQYKNAANATFMGASPVQFREKMDELYSKSLITPFPVSLTDQHEQLIRVFDLARKASFSFEKFIILDQYDRETADSIVNQAYDLIKQSKQQQADLSSQFEAKGLRGDLAALQTFYGN